jgi:hypothetical protein
MLALEKLIREEATEELERIYRRIREISGKVGVLEAIDGMDYKDFEACSRIYVMPAKLK